jgi:hypothetical protein
VLTSRDKPGRKTGYRLEEFATPCYVFRYAGVELTLASPKGGRPPIYSKSDLPEGQTRARRDSKGIRCREKASTFATWPPTSPTYPGVAL